ncbi:MAG TPA: hypothetical protein VHK91_15400, partial [Flavisolibacter sp.]|nr:hypothetical protein [Flavisolibacter sp.]
MNRIFYLFLLALCTLAFETRAQDTLPNFSVRSVGNNRVIVGWVNNYPVTKQISIQRSHDSLKNYKTILSVTDPAAIQNGFADTKAPNDHMYYRLFINLDKGEFFFTPAKRPFIDSAVVRTVPPVNPVNQKPKDTTTTTKVPPVIKKPDFVPSFYVYTN